jgi:hypothetical protein
MAAYPSHAIGSKAIAMNFSYTWTEDASRLNTFVWGSTVGRCHISSVT